MNGRPGALRHLRGVLVLAFAIALAAGVLVTAGGTLLARARDLGVPVAADGRFFVVARGPLAEATRAALEGRPEIQLVAEHSIDQLLGETMSLRTGSETLRVLEVKLPRQPGDDFAEAVATLQRVDGVVEVIALDPSAGASAPALAPRHATVGGVLVAFGCALFGAGLILTATMAVREWGDELAVRFLLGADPASLWRPLGAVLGITALAGALGAVVATYAVARLLGAGQESTMTGVASTALGAGSRIGLAVATCAFVLGAVGSAALAARRAVMRITAEPVRLVALALLALVLGEGVAGAMTSVPTDWQVLRGVGRELASCRKGLLEAERTLAETEIGAVRAYARQDAVLVRLATVQRDQDARLVERWRESCAALELRRVELRVLHRASLAPGPPVEPRRPPVTGGLAVAFGEAGRSGKPHAFRNGVGLRVRPGEVVRATAPGKVVYSGDLAGAGRVVVISHGRRTYSVYGRVAEALVVRGMQVEAGEPVAEAGVEPRVIYFSVRERGKPIDPVIWLREEPVRAPGG